MSCAREIAPIIVVWRDAASSITLRSLRNGDSSPNSPLIASRIRSRAVPNQRYDVAGKTVLITGAARGIGAETARRLHARGANVALVGLEPDELAARAREL